MGRVKNNYLLDTCVLIWLCSRPGELSLECRKCIEAADNNLWVSDVSALELSLKYGSGKMKLPQSPRLWFRNQVVEWSLQNLAISQEHIFRLVEMEQHHKDPFDRLIISQALSEDFVLLTPDSEIQKYSVSVLW